MSEETEPKLKLRAKTLINFEGRTYQEGEIFELRERAALDLVGQGNAEEIIGGAEGTGTGHAGSGSKREHKP